MNNWSLLLVDTTGNQVSDLPDATDRKVAFKLNAADEVRFKLPGTSTSAALLHELATDVIVQCDGVQLSRCRVGSTSDELTEDDHTIDVAAVGYEALLDRRYFMTANTYTNADLTAIAWDTIDYTQRRVAWGGGDWGITRGLTAVTRNVTHTIAAGKKIGEAISDLHLVSPGFDYEIDAARKFNVWTMRGQLRDFALDYGANVSRITRTIDPSKYANAVRASGADGVPVAHAVAPDLASRSEGRFEQQEGNTDNDSAALVQQSANAYLERHGTLLPTYTMTLTPAVWAPSKFWLGDRATVFIRSGRLDVLTQERVFQIDVTLGDDGEVDAELTFGDLRENLLALVREVPGQIEQINRR